MNDFAFTGGRPDPDTFPTEKLIEASAKALQNLGLLIPVYQSF